MKPETSSEQPVSTPRGARSNLGPPWWSTWLGMALGGFALVVALVGLVAAQRTHARLTALETRITRAVKAMETRKAMVREADARMARRDRPARRSGGARRRAESKGAPRQKGGGAADRPSPEARQQRVREEMTATVEGFGEDQGLDEAMVGQVLGELEARSDAVRAVLQDLAAGTVSPEQAREEVQWVRDESAQTLRGLLGDELYDELDRHLAQRAPRRRRAAAVGFARDAQ